jgi:hypothetical protein
MIRSQPAACQGRLRPGETAPTTPPVLTLRRVALTRNAPWRVELPGTSLREQHWPPRHRLSWVSPMLGVATTLSAGEGVGTHQSSGRAAKSRLAFLYHAIPDRGFFHLPCISLKALLCVSSPLATVSFRWLSCAFMTSFAVFPWCEKSHGPPNCLHVIVFISLVFLSLSSAAN